MKKTAIILSGLALIALGSCGSKEKNDKGSDVKNVEKVDKDTTVVREENLQQFDEIFANIPSPIIMANMLKAAGVEGNTNLLHDPNAFSSYNEEKKQAINMGIYTSDFNYCNVLGLKHKQIEYLSTVLTLAQNLGLGSAINTDLVERFRVNENNQDSIVKISSETYGSLENYLREEHREKLAVYMMAGGIVEMLYLGTHVGEENEKIIQALSDHKTAVDNMFILAEKIIGAGESEIKSDIESLKSIFDKMEEKGERTETKEEDGELVIGAKPSPQFNHDQFVELKDKVSELRTKYITK